MKSQLRYLLINFAAPIVFYITFNWLGPKPAIAFAVGTTILQTLVHLIYRLKFSPFFLIASTFTVLFGSLDLILQSPNFFRFQPAAQNFIIATLLLVTYLARIPIALKFLEALPEGLKPNTANFDPAYFRRLTGIWILYLYFKAGIFFYLALKVNLGQLIVLRSVIGGSTLSLLFLGELLYRKRLAQKKARQEANAQPPQSTPSP